jgi:5-methylcytosine-specific restriction endonuclease McrA
VEEGSGGPTRRVIGPNGGRLTSREGTRRVDRCAGWVANNPVVTRSEAARRLAAFAEAHMTPAQAVAFISAVASHHGVRWSTPSGERAYDAVRSFAEHYLRPADVERYLGVLESRRLSSQPLVSDELVSAVQWPQEERRQARRQRKRRGGQNPPKSADEWLEQQRVAASRQWHEGHAEVLRTNRFAALRKQRLRVAGGKCERCRRSDQLQLHHRHYASLGAEQLDDVEILCEDCHRAATEQQRARRRALWRGFIGKHNRRRAR